jgi:hypothetical protein
MPKKFVIRDPFLEEYIYTLSYNVTSEQKKNLGKSSLKILSTSTRAKNFSTWSSLDEKQKFLAEIGMRYYTLIVPDEINTVNELKVMMKKYEDGRANAGVEHAAKMKIFITSDKETTHLLGLASATIHHDNYLLSLDLMKTGHALKKWSKRVTNKDHEESKDAIDYADLLDRLFYESIIVSHYTEGLIGLKERDFLIIMYLHRNRHVYLSKERINDNFRGILPLSGVTSGIKQLLMNNYIRKHVDYMHPRYMITASGVQLISQFRNRVLAAINL